MNQIFAIKPYLWEELWVFDDPAVGLAHEPFVAGIPEMLMAATQRAGIANPEKGFLALFSHDSFPGADIELEWVRQDGGGNVYRWRDMEGWLCPALFRYFPSAPQKLFIQVKPATPFNEHDAAFEAWFAQHGPSSASFDRQTVHDLALAAWQAGQKSAFVRQSLAQPSK